MAHDSTSEVTMALKNEPTLSGAFLMSLSSKMIRITIINVRRTLRAMEIEKNTTAAIP